MKIVITGGIASGKTLATEYLKSKGFSVIDADVVSRDVARQDCAVRRRVAEVFGGGFVTGDGFDRSKLREFVFADPARVAALNEIMLPVIYARMQASLDAADGAAVVAAPLWFDTPYRLKGIDEVWTITAPEELRIKRLIARDTSSQEAARRILRAQADDAQRIAGSDRVFVNDGSAGELYRRIDAALGE